MTKNLNFTLLYYDKGGTTVPRQIISFSMNRNESIEYLYKRKLELIRNSTKRKQ